MMMPITDPRMSTPGYLNVSQQPARILREAHGTGALRVEDVVLAGEREELARGQQADHRGDGRNAVEQLGHAHRAADEAGGVHADRAEKHAESRRRAGRA